MHLLWWKVEMGHPIGANSEWFHSNIVTCEKCDKTWKFPRMIMDGSSLLSTGKMLLAVCCCSQLKPCCFDPFIAKNDIIHFLGKNRLKMRTCYTSSSKGWLSSNARGKTFWTQFLPCEGNKLFVAQIAFCLTQKVCNWLQVFRHSAAFAARISE